MRSYVKNIVLVGLCSLSSFAFGLTSEASKLVTSDIPLESKYYLYLDKMEAMGYMKDMSSATKPYSRYIVAKRLAKVNPEGMPNYLRVYYDEMCNELSDEIAYIIVHEPLNPETGREMSCDKDHTPKAEGYKPKKMVMVISKKAAKNREAYLNKANAVSNKYNKKKIDAYYADQYNALVAEKISMADSEHFDNNVKLRTASAELSAQSMDQMAYTYRRTDASYQPLHGQNNGYRYGEGVNAVGKVNVSGNLGNDLAVSITPRVSYDKDQHGKASLQEGYARTHLGVMTVTAGKQALNWGSQFGNAGLSLSDNATPHPMVQIGLLEPIQTKAIGKIDGKVFMAKMGKHRTDSFLKWKLDSWNPSTTLEENDHGNFWGARLEFQPADFLTLGMQRISIDKRWFGSKLVGDRYEDYKKANDQAGYDLRLKFPGLQLFGDMYGEYGSSRASDLFIGKKSYRYGIYIPQLAKDGSWDAVIEYNHNTGEWNYHGGEFPGGWSYHHDIIGEPMEGGSNKIKATVRNYMKNGDTLGFSWSRVKGKYFTWMSQNGHDWAPTTYNEYELSYSHKLREQLFLDAAAGFAKIKNAENNKGRTDKAKYMAMGVRWEY